MKAYRITLQFSVEDGAHDQASELMLVRHLAELIATETNCAVTLEAIDSSVVQPLTEPAEDAPSIEARA